MPIYLRQSTASQEVPLGYFLDSVDGNSEETGLTIANTDIKVWKTGATTLANKNSGGATHIANGLYFSVLDATDTDTIGPLVLFVHVAGALSVRLECCVLDEAMYDWQFGTAVPSTHSASDVWAVGTRLLTAGTNIALAKGTGVTGFNDLSAAQVNAEADTALSDVGVTLTVTGRIDAGVTTRASQTSVDDLPTNAELATSLGTADDAVLAAIAALNNLSQANIRTAVGLATANLDTQLDALPTNAELATALGTADDAVLAAIAALNNLSQANIRTAVGLGSANLDTQLDALPTNAELATALGTADDAVLAAISGIPTAIQNADALLNRDMSTGTDSGSATVRTVRQALRALRNKWTISAGTLTIYKEDDSTSSWVGTVATDATADPIVSNDPASS